MATATFLTAAAALLAFCVAAAVLVAVARRRRRRRLGGGRSPRSPSGTEGFEPEPEPVAPESHSGQQPPEIRPELEFEPSPVGEGGGERDCGESRGFVARIAGVFQALLGRPPTQEETDACAGASDEQQFLATAIAQIERALGAIMAAGGGSPVGGRDDPPESEPVGSEGGLGPRLDDDGDVQPPGGGGAGLDAPHAAPASPVDEREDARLDAELEVATHASNSAFASMHAERAGRVDMHRPCGSLKGPGASMEEAQRSPRPADGDFFAPATFESMAPLLGTSQHALPPFSPLLGGSALAASPPGTPVDPRHRSRGSQTHDDARAMLERLRDISHNLATVAHALAGQAAQSTVS